VGSIAELSADYERNGKKIFVDDARGKSAVKERYLVVDENVAKEILDGRIFETDNPSAFIEWARIYDFGIIALDNLKSVDATDDPARNVTAKAIIAAIMNHQLWSRGKAFKGTLYDGGASILEDMD